VVDPTTPAVRMSGPVRPGPPTLNAGCGVVWDTSRGSRYAPPSLYTVN
jgi:hypothetical protein